MSEEIDVFEIDEVKQIVESVNDFCCAMNAKMLNKLAEGYQGWSDPTNEENIISGLKRHLDKGFNEPSNLVDIANFCMMLYNMQTR